MEEKEKSSKKSKENKKLRILLFCITIISILVILTIIDKEGSVEIKVKSSLDRIVEKSDLQTVNLTYNVIAKQCKNKDECNKNSNNIDDFEYVVSCKGTVTAGIEFEQVKVEVDKKNHKIILNIPEATIKEINIGTLNFLNGEDISANELPNARELCENTIKEKAKNDDNLLPAAKEQAETVLQSFYAQWIKSLDKEYKVEIK